MCSRIAQYRLKQAYAQAMGWSVEMFAECPRDRVPNWNVPPGSQPWLMHRLRSGKPGIEMMNWGYRPSRADEIGVPLTTSVGVDEAMVGPYFKPLAKAGRAVVPVDGWYEWTTVGGVRQPWFVQRKSRQPFFLAAISSYRAHNVVADDTGFVLVCPTRGGGVVDAGDQRPLALEANSAALWIDPDLSVEKAAHIAQTSALAREQFEWFRVTLEVNRYASNRSDLIAPLTAHSFA